MFTRDQYGLAVSNASSDAIASYDAYAFSFISYGPDIRLLFAAADDAPDAPLLQAHAAGLHMAFEGREGFESAQPYLEKMRAAAKHARPREAAYCEAVEAWARRDYRTALSRFDAVTAAWPADLCAIKWAQYHAFNLGDDAALRRLGDRAMIAHRNAPFAHGMRAFGLEQSHRIGEAEDEARRALDIEPGDAWAHHAMAHVFETLGRAEEGAQWMRANSAWWADRGVFIRLHNWWHTALFNLTCGRTDEAVSIFDERLVGEWPEFPQEQIGAVSMLWRLEMRGVEVGDRWAPVVEQARARAGETLLPFHELHYAYAVARAGTAEESAAQLAHIDAAGESGMPHADVWRGVVAPAARGVIAFAQDRYEDAAIELGEALPGLQSIGGSHAQRHVFVEALAYARAQAAPSAAAA